MVYDVRARHDHLRTRVRGVRSVEVIYRRKGVAIRTDGQGNPLGATVYELHPETLLAYGVSLDEEHRDYILDLEPLVSGRLVQPEPGDRIEEVESGLVARVIPRGMTQVFRYTSSRRDAVRIYTQVISADA
jgi:hypothetical protein